MQRKSWIVELRAAAGTAWRRYKGNGARQRTAGRNASFEALEDRAMLAAVGDYNTNGTVDAADYVLWSKTLNNTVSVPSQGADGNGDGRIDTDDYAIWRNNFGLDLVPPTITSNGGSATALVNVEEHNTAVTTVQASGGAPVTYSITGGVDQAQFSLDSSSGVLTFITAPDYDTPTDANSDEEYVVEVTATNAFGTDVQTITVNVINYYFDDVQIPPNQAALDAFTAYGTIGSAHYGIITYVPLAEKWEIGDGSEPLSIFDPGPDFSWVDYLTKMKNIGSKAVMLTTKHVDGFTLWPSAVTPDHSIAGTEWYANNGQRNLLKEFCDTARSMGMDVGFYFSLWDGFQKTKAGGSYNGAYRTAMYGQLNELMTQFGDIKFIVLDAWGDFWTQFDAPGYGDMPRATVYNYLRSLQPNCLIGINAHEWVSGDFWIFEGEVDHEPPPGITLKPVFWWAPMQATDYVWFTHSDSVVEDVQAGITENALRRDHMHERGYVWGPNVSPGPSGVLPPDLSAILEGLALPTGSGAQVTSSSYDSPQSAATESAGDAATGLPAASALAEISQLIAGAVISKTSSDAAPLAWVPSLRGNAANATETSNAGSSKSNFIDCPSVVGARSERASRFSDDDLLLARALTFVDRPTRFKFVPMTSSDDYENAVPVGVIDSYFETFKDEKRNALLSM